MLTGCGKPKEPVYQIKFDRPFRVGQSYHQSTDGEQAMEQKFSGQSRSTNINRSLKFTLEADMQVLEIDSDQQPNRLRAEVQKLTRVLVGQSKDLIKSRSSYILKRNARGKTEVEQNGVTISNETAKLLQMISYLPDGRVSDDQLFAPTRPMPLGASWSYNADLLASELYDPDFLMEINQCTGAVQLISLTNCSETTCFILKSDFHAADFQLTVSKRLPALKGTMEMQMTRVIPTNPVPLPLEREEVMTARASFATNLFNRLPIRADATITLKLHSVLKPVPDLP